MFDLQKRQVTGSPGLSMTDIQEARELTWRLLKSSPVGSDMTDCDMNESGVSERQVLRKGK
jgi:hypothetical protein